MNYSTSTIAVLWLVHLLLAGWFMFMFMWSIFDEVISSVILSDWSQQMDPMRGFVLLPHCPVQGWTSALLAAVYNVCYVM